jgi:hypothetical protein
MRIKLLRPSGNAGELELSDKGTTEVNPSGWFRRIVWKTVNEVEIKKFKIVGDPSYNPFETDIPTDYLTKVKLKVAKDQSARDWKYSIDWIDKNDKSHLFDPKIAIKPKAFTFLEFLVSLLCGFLGLYMLQSSLRKKK